MPLRYSVLAVLLACVVVLLTVRTGVPTSPATARGSVPYVALSRVTNGGGDRLDVVVRVRTALPGIRCVGTAEQAGRFARLPRLRTGAQGGAQWHWYMGDGAPRAQLEIRVRCRFPNSKTHSKSISQNVGPGPFERRPFRELVKGGHVFREAWNPQKTHDGSGGGGNLYPRGQCTWYVAMLRPDLPYFEGPGGDAKNWIESARARNLPTGTEPRVGAVAVFQPGQYQAGAYGHVAYVTAVMGSTMIVTEANFQGGPAGTKRPVGSEGVQFIYRKVTRPPSSLPTLVDESFAVKCTSKGQFCLPVHGRRVHHGGGAIRVRFVAIVKCSRIKVKVHIVDWDDASSGLLGDGMSYNHVFTNLPPGDYTVQLQAQGVMGGCNHGSQLSWAGHLKIVTSIR